MSDELELEREGGWWESRNKNAALVLVFVVMLAAKLLTMMLPAKYFYDNNRILGMANGVLGVDAWSGTYETTATLFRTINFLDLTSMNQWSWLLGFIMTILVFFMILHIPEPDIVQTVFLLACVGLLNIYVFNIGKDVIQFAFFFAVYLVLMLPIQNQIVKILLAAGVLYFESKVFREYYILIAVLVLAVYCILTAFRHLSKIPSAGRIIGTIVSLYLLVCCVMLASMVLMPSEYQQIMEVRYASISGRDTSAAAAGATIISNWIGGDNTTSLPLFLLNYLINAVRMMIPFELAVKGVQYLPFFLFQVAVTVYLVHLFGKLDEIDDEVQFLAISVFLGYVLASVLFEPDFGSWVRHEAATFPVLHLLVLSPNQQISQWKRDINKVKDRFGKHSHAAVEAEV